MDHSAALLHKCHSTRDYEMSWPFLSWAMESHHHGPELGRLCLRASSVITIEVILCKYSRQFLVCSATVAPELNSCNGRSCNTSAITCPNKVVSPDATIVERGGAMTAYGRTRVIDLIRSRIIMPQDNKCTMRALRTSHCNMYRLWHPQMQIDGSFIRSLCGKRRCAALCVGWS